MNDTVQNEIFGYYAEDKIPFSADGFKGYYDGQKMMDRITALPSANS